MSALFLDCLDREIKVDDVIAGKSRVAIVRGFTAEKIVVDVVCRDYQSRGRLGADGHPLMQRWKLGKTWFNVGYKYFITGMSEADLCKTIGINMEDREDNETIS